MFRLRVRYEALRLRGPEIIDQATRDAEYIAEQVIKEAGEYPPIPGPPNRYERTYVLASGWYQSNPYRRGNVVGVYIGNSAPYFDYVVGLSQRDYHGAHGWKRLIDVLKPYEIDFANRITRTIGRFWR